MEIIQVNGKLSRPCHMMYHNNINVLGRLRTSVPDGEYCDLVTNCEQVLSFRPFHIFFHLISSLISKKITVLDGMVDFRGKVNQSEPIIAIIADQ